MIKLISHLQKVYILECENTTIMAQVERTCTFRGYLRGDPLGVATP